MNDDVLSWIFDHSWGTGTPPQSRNWGQQVGMELVFSSTQPLIVWIRPPSAFYSFKRYIYYIESMNQLQLNWILWCFYVKHVSFNDSSNNYDLIFFNESSTFRHILFILYLEEKLLCVLIIDNCSKSGLFYSLHDYTLLCMLFFRKNFQPTITRQKKEIKKKLNRICLPSFPSKESCSFLLYFTASVRPWL